MHDPVDVRERLERVIARVGRRDEYGQLLAWGELIHRVEDGEDIESWRAAIKRQARADEIKVRTGCNDRIVWALRARPEQPGSQEELRRYSELVSRGVPLAVERCHQPSVVLRDGDEAICGCERCRALGYGHVADDVLGGPLFEDDCSHDEPPQLTGLATMYVPRSRRP